MNVTGYIYTVLVSLGVFVMLSPIVLYWVGDSVGTTTVGWVMLALSTVLPALFVRRRG